MVPGLIILFQLQNKKSAASKVKFVRLVSSMLSNGKSPFNELIKKAIFWCSVLGKIQYYAE